MTREELIESIIQRVYVPYKQHPLKGRRKDGSWHVSWDVPGHENIKFNPKTPYKVGDVLEIEHSGHIVHIKVEEKLRNVKDGHPGFTGTILKTEKKWPEEFKRPRDRQKWAYNEQIIRKVS